MRKNTAKKKTLDDQGSFLIFGGSGDSQTKSIRYCFYLIKNYLYLIFTAIFTALNCISSNLI